MKSMKFDYLKIVNKKNKSILFLSFVFIICFFIILYNGVKYENKSLPMAVGMHDLITNFETVENVYSYIDVNTSPFLFATYETNGDLDNEQFYFVMDSSNSLYIVRMSLDDYENLNVKDINNNSIRIYGLTKKVDESMIKIAIETYNDELKEEYLTRENFSKYVGLIYLDMTEKIYDATLYYIGATICLILFIMFFSIFLLNYFKSKNIIKKYSKEELYKINLEIMMLKNNSYSKMNLYLLNDYLVDASNSLVIINYDDITCIKIYEKKCNGLTINKNLKVMDKNNKVYSICNTKYLDNNKNFVLEEVIEKICLKNLNIKAGYLKK